MKLAKIQLNAHGIHLYQISRKNEKKTKNAGKILLESISHIGIRWTLCYLELLVLKPMYYNYTYLSTSFLLPVMV